MGFCGFGYGLISLGEVLVKAGMKAPRRKHGRVKSNISDKAAKIKVHLPPINSRKQAATTTMPTSTLHRPEEATTSKVNPTDD
jgi:hypothetical protein